MADNPQHCDQDGDGHFGQAHRHAWNEEQVGDDQALHDDQGRVLSATPVSQRDTDGYSQRSFIIAHHCTDVYARAHANVPEAISSASTGSSAHTCTHFHPNYSQFF